MEKIPVITIDGTTGSGKGSVGSELAEKLGWHFLDSGAIYRVLALAALQQGLMPADSEGLHNLACSLHVEFKKNDQLTQVIYADQDVTSEIRQEKCGIFASQIAVLPVVREALLECQRSFRKSPGLVADGRDMGTVVFPAAVLKVFLDADANERALRRQKQLQKYGESGSFQKILQDLVKRDQRDQERVIAPLKPADNAVVIDTTKLSIDEVLQQILQQAKARGVVVQRTEDRGQKAENEV